MTSLLPGGNVPVATDLIRVEVAFSAVPGVDIDVCAFALGGAGKVRGDHDMCFYGQPAILGGAVRIMQATADRATFSLDLGRLDAAIDKVALTATLYENKASFDKVASLSINVVGCAQAQIATAGMRETALILGEFYRRQGQWTFRCVGQGFAGGLAPLATHFGVQVAPAKPAVPVPAPTAAAAPKPSLRLSKVTLDKTRSTISLEKTQAGFGEIRVNLNWNHGAAGRLAKSKPIDLDLGCLYELHDGSKGVIQALGNSFGDLARPPYIKLMGDDRTGTVGGGEWLHINGLKWPEINRILIFAFIYDGAPNWQDTDGVVTLSAPGQPDIEVRLNEEGGRLGCCAIALLENSQGAVKISRTVDFHKSQGTMDQAYGWGMRWRTGSK